MFSFFFIVVLFLGGGTLVSGSHLGRVPLGTLGRPGQRPTGPLGATWSGSLGPWLLTWAGSHSDLLGFPRIS